jgi:hypothetical protein
METANYLRDSNLRVVALDADTHLWRKRIMTRTRSVLTLAVGVWILALWALAVAMAADAAAADPAKKPATQPASKAATQPAVAEPTTQPVKAKPGPVLTQRWRWYKTVWAGRDIASQSKADEQLVDGILKADPAEVATLRDEMAAEYERMAAGKKPDDFQLGRLAARLVVAWTRSPTGKEVSSPQMAINRALGCGEICRWGTIALKHLGGKVSRDTLDKYRGFVPGTAASVMSLMIRSLPTIDKPGDVRDELLPLREPLRTLAAAADARQAETEKIIDQFYESLGPLDVYQADKDAIRKVIEVFPAAYNARDTKAFSALWPAGHKAVAVLATLSLEATIDPDFWTITRWQCAYIVVQKDQAEAYVVSRYRSRDGKDQPVKLQGFPARKDAKEGWKLD